MISFIIIFNNEYINPSIIAEHRPQATHHFPLLYGIQDAGFLHPEDQGLSREKTRVMLNAFRIKVLGDQEVYPNDIIARQRGFKWKSGKNVIVGVDQTIHAKVEGIVKFRISN